MGRSQGDSDPVVLVVEDEPNLAELYAAYLNSACEVHVAGTGDEALELIDDNLDVALLDRRLPEWQGDELVNVIHERHVDCGIVMVTAVEPDLDIADLPVDDYLTKPVSRDELRETVEEILFRLVGGDDRREFLALLSRKLALEAQFDEDELRERSEYAKLTRRIALAEDRLDLHPVSQPSKHRPDACPACGLRWDVLVDGTAGYVVIGSRVWKCVQCGNIESAPAPQDRFVFRR